MKSFLKRCATTMKSDFLLKLFICTSILFMGQSIAQCPDITLYTQGFSKLESHSFNYFNDKLDEVKIVGFGEDTHGSAEFTELADVLFSYLFENHKYNIIILETGFGEGLYLDDYIKGKTDNIKDLLSDSNKNSTWRYRTKEFISFMNRLRALNQKNNNVITIYGSEMQYPYADVVRLNKLLVKGTISYQLPPLEKHIWQPIGLEEQKEITDAFYQLRLMVNAKEEVIQEKLAEQERFELKQHIEIVGQFITVIIQESQQEKADLRDLYIAENIKHILNFHENDKAFFWAHNVHIGDWVSNGIVDVAGHHLKKQFGDTYYSIATDFGSGKFKAFPHNANEVGWQLKNISFDNLEKDTFTYCLASLGNPNLIFDLRKARESDKLLNYFNKDLKIMYGAGAQEWGINTQTVPIGKAFDAIIYLDEVTPITSFE